jgi:hypothetical protein
MKIHWDQWPEKRWLRVHVVELSRDLRLQDIILEGDSLKVVTMILEHEASWSRIGQIGANIKLVMDSSRSWVINHVKRLQTTATHGLPK